MQSEQAVLTIGEIFQKVGESLREFVKTVGNIISDVAKIQEKIEKERLLRSTWEVLQKITMQSQVMDRKPFLIRVRTDC